MKITRLKVSNYRGIEQLDTELSSAGAVVKGRNGGGKTTTLNAIRAALSGVDVNPDAIRNGAEKAEILIDVDDVSIRRLITKKQSSLRVTKGGMEAKAPVKFLAELLGDCALDPLDLITKKRAERKAVVLSALPVSVSAERLATWAPGLPAGFSCEGHGLDVVGRAHEYFYGLRKDANATAKAAEAEAERLAGLAGAVPEGLELSEAIAAYKAAERALVEEEANERVSRESEERSRAAREKANALRAEADALVVGNVDGLQKAAKEAERILADIREQLEKANEVFALANRQFHAAQEGAKAKAALVREADALVQGIGPAAKAADVAGARARFEQAEAAGRQARVRDEAIKAAATAKDAKAKAAEATEEARRLDGIVRTLADDAPAALLAESNGIPGLTLVGDDVAWKGVALGSLCGAEQVTICVEIARRLNEKSKILVVDGLERLDPEQLDIFLRESTRDGYQLIASKVDRGDVVIEAIEADIAKAAE